MPVEEARAALLQALDIAPDTAANFTIRGQALADCDIALFDLTRDLAAQVTKDVAQAVEALTTKQFLTYDPSYQTNASQVLVEDLDQIPDLASVDGLIRSADVPDDAGGRDVVAMVHALGVGAEQVVAYRLKGPGIAARRRHGIQLIPRDGVYGPIEGDVLYYEPRFDVFTCGGYAYFTTVTLIQSKLHADHKARALAKQTLADVTKQVLIEGYGDLERAVMDDPTLRAKMASVARLIEADPDYGALLTTQRLVAFIQANPDYGIPVMNVEGELRLRFDASPQHRHQIPRLLADDYLHSLLTNRNYEAGSKHHLQAGSP